MIIDLSKVPEHSRRVTKYEFFRALQNGRIRYYKKFQPAKTLGKTAGARMVTEDETIEAEFLRDMLYDVVMQWECLSANLDLDSPEFPEVLLKDWLSRVQKWESDRTPEIEAAIV